MSITGNICVYPTISYQNCCCEKGSVEVENAIYMPNTTRRWPSGMPSYSANDVLDVTGHSAETAGKLNLDLRHKGSHPQVTLEQYAILVENLPRKKVGEKRSNKQPSVRCVFHLIT